MTLVDLRKLSIRKHLKIRFQLSNGMECVITEHGLAQVPTLQRVPGFNLEQELSSVSEFVLEPVGAAAKRPVVAPKAIGREELTSLIGSSPTAAAEHEDE
ncbi:MAG TPA: hypothetical protein VG096_01090 [Bryobacteraceae bacterium]|jgi:hypothetical protein|nr:hypothetical protein [Bryobacteraceae bacterium]